MSKVALTGAPCLDSRPTMPHLLTPGESPLSAFISSVMREETTWARDTATDALTINPTLVPWAFEHTPASSGDAVSTYLEKVRECDIFVWLAWSETTEAVANEVREALAHGKRMWVFLLPAESRDALTGELIAEVRTHIKTVDVHDADHLRELVSLTYSDEVIRAMRAKPGYTRLAYLEQLGRRSRARMVSRWMALGLQTAEAIGFANDPSVGAPPREALPTDEARLRVLVGPVGAGKSVVAERALQLAIVSALEWETAPIPVFLHMRDTRDGLEAALRAATEEIGDVRLQGVFAVVDGADEVETPLATRVIEEARELVAALPQTQILVTSRPTAVLEKVRERVELPELSPDEARALVGRVAGYEVTVGMEGGWPASVQDAIRRPLFAILLGLNRRAGQLEPTSTGELLDALVREAIEAAEIAEFVPLMRRLAAFITERGGPVEASTIGGLPEQVATHASRLVRQEGELVDFALPVLTQWFAAEALTSGTVTAEEVVAEPSRLDRWRYALAIALSRGSAGFIEAAMDALVSSEPGFAAEIVEDSFRSLMSPSESAAVPAIEAGERLRHAFETWGRAIEPLDRLVLPERDNSGKLPTLGVQVGGGYFEFGWRRGFDLSEPVVELPSGTSILRPPDDWLLERVGVWADERGWSWRWSLETLRGHVKQLLERRHLEVGHRELLDEALWVLSQLAARRGTLDHTPIPRADVEALVSNLDVNTPLIRLTDRFASTSQILRRLAEMNAAGETDILPPWPGPDLSFAGGGFIWDPYSPERQLERTRAVYGAALSAYAAIADAWFPKLKARMQMAVTMPAVLRGAFRPSPAPPSQFTDTPTLSWYLDPLPRGEQSRVEIQFEEEVAAQRGDEEWRERLERRHRKLVDLRPEASNWISITETFGVSDVFQGAPLAPLVYDWLKRDLDAIKWQ